MKEYRGKRYRYVNNLKDMQTIYEIASDNSCIIYSDFEYSFKYGCNGMRDVSLVTNTDRYYTITTMYAKDFKTNNGIEYRESNDKHVSTWIFDKTDTECYHIHPSSVARRSNNVYKPFNVVDHKDLGNIWDVTADGKILQSAKPIIGYNPKYNGTEHHVVCYDLNSAYGQPLLDKIPDTYKMECYRNVGENEVGFLFDDNLTMVDKVGEYADFVFPLLIVHIKTMLSIGLV